MIQAWRSPMALKVIHAAIVAIAVLGGKAAAQTGDSADAALGMLKEAVTEQRSGMNLTLLFGLRQLRDPDLKPFFVRLSKSPQWQSQVHAALGLAEIDPVKRVDANLVRVIDPKAQESVIATGLDLELIGLEQIRELMKIENLQPMAKLFLIADLVARKEKVEAGDLEALAKSEDNHVAGLASMLLAQIGQNKAWSEYPKRLEALDAAARTDITVWLIEAARRYELTAAAGWITSILSDANVDENTAYRAVFALLDLDQPAGLKVWKKQLGEKPSYQQRVRYGLLLLAAKTPPPATAFDTLISKKEDDDGVLVTRMVNVGKALSSGADPSHAMIDLLALNHGKTTEWAAGRMTKLPPDQAARVYKYLIDRLGGPEPENDTGDSVSLAVQATSKLFEIDPDAVLQRLAKSEDDSMQQQAILLGLLETASPKAGEAASSLRRIGSGRADSLALLLTAKHSKTLTQPDAAQLGRIAAGGGRVSEVLQAQAAWLYLKHTGRAPSAIETVFKDAK